MQGAFLLLKGHGSEDAPSPPERQPLSPRPACTPLVMQSHLSIIFLQNSLFFHQGPFLDARSVLQKEDRLEQGLTLIGGDRGLLPEGKDSARTF